MGGILYPVFQHEKQTGSEHYVHIERRFIGFVWMCVWTTAITGIFLILFSNKFVLGQYRSEWDYLLLLKVCIYVIMVGVAVSGTGIVKRMEAILASAGPEERDSRLTVQHRKILARRRTNLALGIILLLISTRLASH